MPEILPVLAEVVRSGFTEGRHRGSLVVLAADGSVTFALGDPEAPVFPRSANKPFQAAAVLRSGLELSGERLALAAASHAAEGFHLDLVRTMLAEHGLTTADLKCPASLPLDAEEAEAFLAAGHTRTPLAMDCSGKHTAMLAACQANGWPLDSYLDPDHPLQKLVRETLEEATGDPVAHTGVDGCGAPLMAVSLTGLARGYRALALASAQSPEGRVVEAMRAHPAHVGGTRRHDTWLMRELPGAVSKMGAEAVQGIALPDGSALALKVEDGAERALGPVVARALSTRMGVSSAVLDRLATVPVLGGGVRVGEIRAAF
ncbi:asparaginase [Streptomyces qinglanensis]|uniref:asparaginase n=1 Tax=Streptomyces qinglanensis TaxID=943816 RepID=UPI003D71966A